MKRITSQRETLSMLKNEIFTQAKKYSIVGVICTVFDFALLFILTLFAGLTSSIISFMSGTLLNYYSYTFWIFLIRTVDNHYHEFINYAIIPAIILGINTILIWSFTEIIGLYFKLSTVLQQLLPFGRTSEQENLFFTH